MFQCETNATYAFACVEALNALAGNLDTPVIFALAEELESNPIIGKQIKAYPSGLNLYARKEFTPKNAQELLQMQKKIKASHLLAMQKLGAQPELIQFRDLFTEYTAQFMKSKAASHEARMAGVLYNQFNAVVEDPHTIIRTAKELQSYARSETSEGGCRSARYRRGIHQAWRRTHF